MRISLMVVLAMAFLLIASMAVMFYHSRKAVEEEAIQKALQSLEGATRCIDNVLLSVEQTTGNAFFSMLPHLNDREKMFTYSRMLVETNPYVAGCAIAFKPDFYEDRKYFMAYVHRGDSAGIAYADSELVTDEFFGHRLYTEQDWYKIPMETGKAGWVNPNTSEEADLEPIFTFALPIKTRDGEPLGVIGVDISLSHLSRFVAEAKPSPNSYCTLIDQDGSFIVSPNSDKLMKGSALELTEESAKEAAQAMMSGETGYKPFRLDGEDYYIFYKPFQRETVFGRSEAEIKWSAGMIYPEDDIFGDYKSLSYYIIAIAAFGLTLLYLFSRIYIHRQMKPLFMLAEKAQLIAKGNYNEIIPDSHHRTTAEQLPADAAVAGHPYRRAGEAEDPPAGTRGGSAHRLPEGSEGRPHEDGFPAQHDQPDDRAGADHRQGRGSPAQRGGARPGGPDQGHRGTRTYHRHAAG